MEKPLKSITPKGIFLLVFISITTLFSQNVKGQWSIGINPLSLAEPELSLGPCASYRLSNRFQIWSEASFIFANSYMHDWKNIQGFRFIFQPRYLTGPNKIFFITPEFRIKNFSFDNKLYFTNTQNPDSFYKLNFKENQFLIGGAFILGRKIYFTNNHKFYLEINFGIGAKHRYITRRNIPEGYEYSKSYGRFGLAPNYEDNNTGTVYFPMSYRFYLQL